MATELSDLAHRRADAESSIVRALAVTPEIATPAFVLMLGQLIEEQEETLRMTRELKAKIEALLERGGAGLH